MGTISPWEIDAGKVSGTGTPKPSSPSTRVTYYSQPRPAPLSQYASVSERNLPSLGSVTSYSDRTGYGLHSAGSNTDPAGINWRNASGTMPTSPYLPSGPSGPSSGGSGGGGGVAGLTAEQQAAMARLFSPALMSFTPFQAPAYEAFTPSPRDTAIYDAARRRIRSARNADVAFAQDQGRQLMELLGSQQNVMANPRMTATPQMQQAYQRIVGGAPGNQMVADVIDAENAYSQNSDGAFQNLMALLSAQEERNMQSRAREGQQDQNAILNAIRAQASGMLGGVEMADLRDARDYQRWADEIAMGEHRYGADRDWQTAYGNWQGQTGTDQANVGIRNDWAQMLIDLIPMLTDSGVLGKIGTAPAINSGATVSAKAVRG